jgi:choline dehydrogenase-like flavoprotein
MIVDLAAQEADHQRDAAVVIVGGGIAGLLLGARLRDHGLNVIVLESGGRHQVEDSHPLNRVVQIGHEYSGATRGRFRCLGGTSTRWGGALIPFADHDLTTRSYLDAPAWPIGAGDVRPYLGQVERLFGVDAGSYEEDFVAAIGTGKDVPTGQSDFKVRFAKWPTFKKRNVATLLAERIGGDPAFEVWINATVTDFALDAETGRLRALTARHESGRKIVVAATQVAICAGAIESTRLLQLLDRQYQGRLFEERDALGRYFYDHISMPVATIAARQVERLNRLAGLRFVGQTMRSLRFELSPQAQAGEGVGGAFGHIGFETVRPTGFDALRDLLRSVQKRGRMPPRLLLAAARDIPYIVRTAFWRIAYRQLYWPTPATYRLHAVTEQLPRWDNRIFLADETDRFGLPIPAIDWRVSQQDRQAFSAFRNRFDRYWTQSGLQDIGPLRWSDRLDTLADDEIRFGGDIFHPGGTTRMGVDSSAVVDANLRTTAVPNLWVASTSVFPTGGSPNPTLMLMLLSMRLADRLKLELSAAIAR